jgi:diguanylate cyclase (GGDEF)-like protein/PAS domain S-box-containing protein
VRVRAQIRQALTEGRRYQLQYRIVTRDGHIKWVQERGASVRDETGRPVMEGFVQDVSDQLRTLEALREAEYRYRQIFEHASEGMFQSSREGRYLAANQALARMYGYGSPEQLIADLSDIQHRLYVDESRREAFIRLMEAEGKVTQFESEVLRRDGTRIWISESARAVRSPSGEFICYEGTVQDITERRGYEARLQRQANHDQLTGLPNRNLLRERLLQAMHQAERIGGQVAVVFIDLDNFKFINDALGHAAGDALLVELARRLSRHLRGTDTVARQGGDEFVLVLNDHANVASVTALLDRVVELIAKPMELGGRTLQVGASLGVSLFPRDGRDVDTLLQHADAAMYAAKDRGRNNVQFFTPELNRVASERMHLEAAMRLGLEQGEFSVHFQPQVDAQRRVVGAEALARWHHPRLGPISPDRFIPIAEESGLILALTETITLQACAAARDWPEVDGHPIRLALNLSPKLFIDPHLVARITGWLRQEGIQPQRVELEITESVFLDDPQRALRTLKAFKEKGFHLAMDDFGTGYSSLSYLRHFPLDTIKIDRSLVTDLEAQRDAAMIARAVVSLGLSLGKSVVAEGVEHESQFSALREHGCTVFQGYLFSRPVTAADLLRRLGEGAGAL